MTLSTVYCLQVNTDKIFSSSKLTWVWPHEANSYLSHVSEVLDGITVVGEADTIGRVNREAAMVTHALQQGAVLGAVVTIGEFTEEIASLDVLLAGTPGIAEASLTALAV